MDIKKYTTRILIILAGVLVLVTLIRVSGTPNVSDTNIETPMGAIGDVENLVQVSVVPGSVLSGEQTVTGVLTGAYFFEANARGSLVGADGTVFTEFPITATSDWMTAEEVSFTTTFSTANTTAGPGYLRIANDNASGDPQFDRYIDIPVIFN
jgi:hypothetical protein